MVRYEATMFLPFLMILDFISFSIWNEITLKPADEDQDFYTIQRPIVNITALM